jgi:hypothetical protein
MCRYKRIIREPGREGIIEQNKRTAEFIFLLCPCSLPVSSF